MNTEKEVNNRIYLFTWIALLCLTGLTVWVYFLHLGRAGAVIALSIASVKALLILLFFMNLRQESRFIRTVFLVPVLVLGVLISFTLLDVLLR